MHDSVPCDPIQGQGQGHETLKVQIVTFSNFCLFRHLQWELHGNLNRAQYLNLIGSDF